MIGNIVYKQIIRRVLFCFDCEKVHTFVMGFLKKTSFIANPLFNILYKYDDDILSQKLFSNQQRNKVLFKNPVGLAAGFDKNCDYANILQNFGFGFLEFGTLTPKEQYGNEKPRIFRLIKDKSLQNSMGFSNLGCEYFLNNLKSIKNTDHIAIGVNIGKNKTTKDALKDYEFLLKKFDKKSSYIVINISSPNTKGLRDLQNKDFLADVFKCIKANNISSPVLVKISPDMSKKDTLALCKNAIKLGVDGLIISNTTIDYSLSKNCLDKGGVSGELLCEKSRNMLEYIASNIDYKKTILISCGGINNANEAYKRIKLGASLVQIYTALIYEGVGVCKDINKELSKLLKKDGFSNISQAIGADIQPKKSVKWQKQ